MPCRFGLLTEKFLNSPVVDIGGYKYFVNPVSDGIPSVDKALLDEIIEGVIEVSELRCDLILAPEAMGVPIATGLTIRTGIPFAVIRKRSYGLEGEIRLDQSTGYSRSPMYINGVRPGDRVVLVDDVMSTGGTAKAIVEALEKNGVTVTEVSVVFNKSKDLAAISEELGVPVRRLIDVGVSEDGRPYILDDAL